MALHKLPPAGSPVVYPEEAINAQETPVDPRQLMGIDFARYGLFWDRPDMSNQDFLAILTDPASPEHRWAWHRAFERLPSPVLTGALTLSQLQRLIRLVRLRPPLQGAWESAIEFWTQEARRHPR
jgi:hypothetical protein